MKRIGLFGIAVAVMLLVTTMLSFYGINDAKASIYEYETIETNTTHEETLCEHCVDKVKQYCMDNEYIDQLVVGWYSYQAEYYEARIQEYVIGSVSTKGGVNLLPYEPIVVYELFHREFIDDIKYDDRRILEFEVSMYRMLHEMHEYYGN